jgi:hypothetical protein
VERNAEYFVVDEEGKIGDSDLDEGMSMLL